MKRVIAVMMTLLLILPCVSYAAERIDVDKECSLTISYIDGTTPVAGAICKIYYVATTDDTGEVEMTGDFANYKIDLPRGKDHDKEWNELALTFKSYACRDKIEPVTTATIGDDGTVTVGGPNTGILMPGLYLVAPQVATLGNFEYTGQPIMTFLPGTDSEKNVRAYDWSINIKYNKKEVPPFDPDDDPTHVDISAVKIWKDKGYEKKRPEYVAVELLRNGKVYDTVKLTEKDNWKYTWEKLDAEYEWLVVEKPLDHYKVKIECKDDTYYVINQTDKNNPPGSKDNSSDKTDKLPQTGQLWWPVPACIAVGLLFLVIGFVKRRSEFDEE
ncbi:MAG: Cna B-type domain-containing protein [Clostridiales bacterium]|nr:Cna B-type domain-containing protein [Candidatus Crickella caballi]